MTIGIVSDTHGLLRPEIVTGLAGVDHILHAGDVGNPQILSSLLALAPLTAVRGNIDREGVCANLPATEMLKLNGSYFYMLHSIDDLDLHPRQAGIRVVVSGHSHRPEIRWRDDVLYINPGSAGPRRFSLPISFAKVEFSDGVITPRLIALNLS